VLFSQGAPVTEADVLTADWTDQQGGGQYLPRIDIMSANSEVNFAFQDAKYSVGPAGFEPAVVLAFMKDADTIEAANACRSLQSSA
jgi:hypothetical protein